MGRQAQRRDEFHDGKPVTVDDLKFSMDFICQYDRAEFWVSDQFLEKTEILDRTNRMVRFTFKEPYGQFETEFLLVNVILPKHIFEGLMEKQNVGDNARHLQIPYRSEAVRSSGGSTRKMPNSFCRPTKSIFTPRRLMSWYSSVSRRWMGSWAGWRRRKLISWTIFL